jgi:hypothetical protein
MAKIKKEIDFDEGSFDLMSPEKQVRILKKF